MAPSLFAGAAGAPDAAPVVCKYGGSSLRSLTRLRRVAAAIARRHRRGEPLVVVCSAMGRTTDVLLRRARALDPNASARELDMLVSCGERAAVALLAIALGARAVPVLSLTGSQAGIVTDERHQAARILAVRPHRVVAGLAAGQVVVVAGYQGVSRTHEITTLGRGGSDATAVALGAALQAREVALYSDVDGVYSADPRALAEARHLPAVDYATLHALGLSGARVVCAEATRLAEALGVALWARAAHAPPGASRRETRIGAARAADEAEHDGPGAVTSTPAFCVRVADATALSALEAATYPAAEVRAAAGGVGVFVVGDGAAPKALQAALAAALGAQLADVCAPSTLVGAAGPRVGALPLAPLLAALTRANVAVLHLQRGPRLLQLAVTPATGPAALQVVHAALAGQIAPDAAGAS